MKLPENYNPFEILETRPEMKKANGNYDPRPYEKLFNLRVSPDRIQLVESFFDVGTDLFLSFIWQIIDAASDRIEQKLIIYFIENICDNPKSIDEIICSTITLTFSTAYLRVMREEEKSFVPIICKTIWKKIHGESFVDTLHNERSNIYLYIPSRVTFSVKALILNFALFNETIEKERIQNYLEKYSFIRYKSINDYHSLLEFKFDENIPFYGGKRLKQLIEDYPKTQTYLTKKYSSFEFLDHYTSRVEICSKKMWQSL
jgi:hypothetical protein